MTAGRGPGLAGALAIALALALGAAPVAAGPVAVRVIEVAGEIAYLEPGATAGLAPGTTVTIAGRTLVVIEVTATTAAVRADGTLAVGASGTATVAPAGAPGGPAVTVLPPVRSPETWVAQWPDITVPSAGQHPESRPLGAGRAGRVSAAITLRGAGHVASHGDPTAALEARAEVSAEAWPAQELWADVDVAGRVFTAGTAGPRAPVVIHAARLRVGASDDPRLEAGRLAWVTDQVGALDGVHARHRFGALTVGGFAGLLPGDVDTQPRTSAARFGAELGWDDPGGRWQPRVDLVAVGSTWDGRLDEQRLMLDAEVARGALRGRAWGEVQNFPADNQGTPAEIEVAGAGASVGWWQRGRHLDLDVTFQRPERSLHLDATLPVDWLCLGAAQGGESGCSGASWTDVAASAGSSGARWSVDGGLDVGIEQVGDRFVAASGFVLGELRVLPHGLRLQLSGSGGRARFVDWYGAEAGLALGRRRWDVAVRWRPELVAYTGALDRLWQNGLVVDGRWAVGPRLTVSGSLYATAGGDRNALTAVTTLAWRPLP